MQRGLRLQSSLQKQLLEQQTTLGQRKEAHKALTLAITAQRRHISLDLCSIYPITPVSEGTLQFVIRGISLPSTGEFGDADEEEIATGLGWAAHLVYLLAGYLAVPLRYPVQPIGSRSLIRDPVSIMMGSRT